MVLEAGLMALGAGLAVGLGALGSGIAEKDIGAAAVGAVNEPGRAPRDSFVHAIGGPGRHGENARQGVHG